MSKYGEPFGFGSREIDALVDCNGFVVGRPCSKPEWHYRVYWNEETWRRVFACVNAMAGIEDPEAFVKAAKVLRLNLRWVRDESAIQRLEAAFDAAIGGKE